MNKPASPENTPVPEGFRKDMEAYVLRLDEAERLAAAETPRKARPYLRAAAVAASVALVAALGLGLYNRYTAPKDTFDDPYLAYAAVEDALNRVSEKAGKGLALERESEIRLQETLSVFK